MQPSRWYALFLGKLHDSQPASPVSRQDLGNLCRGKLFLTTGSAIHRHSLSLPAGLNRLHPVYRLPCFCFSQTLLAWNAEGHMVVAQIAYNHLDSAVKARCDALIAVPLAYRGDSTTNFVTAACLGGRLQESAGKQAPGTTSICPSAWMAPRPTALSLPHLTSSRPSTWPSPRCKAAPRVSATKR